MTDAEKRDQKRKVNWVQARSQCTIDGAFDALRSQVKEDVCKANDITHVRRTISFTVDSTSDSEFFVYRLRGDRQKKDPDGIRFYKNTKHLSFRPTKEDKPTMVTMAWDQEKCRCNYLIDGKKVRMWQISQRALCEFIFGK